MAKTNTPIPTPPNRPTSTLLIFLFLVTLRLLTLLTNKTFFQPDEYFQSLEPAWQLAFGTGEATTKGVQSAQSGAWITWEWREQLRSAIHPILFSAVYRTTHQLSTLLRLSRISEANLLAVAPRLLQVVIAATIDLGTWRLAGRVYGRESKGALAALALTVFSPWQWFCSVRTFSNTLESALTVYALGEWPWTWFLETESNDRNKSGSKIKNESPGTALNLALAAAAFACILRPTNIIIWATVSLTLLLRYGSYKKAVTLAQAALLSGSTVLAVSVAVDRTYYGFWTIPPLRFLYFNLVQSLAVFYGRNRPDYYFTEGLPLLLITALPFALIGLWQALRPGKANPQPQDNLERQTCFVLATAVLATILAFTLIAHKEVRFIYPLLPILHFLAAKPMAEFFAPFPLPTSKIRLGLLSLGLVLNIYIAAYVSLVHQRGVIDVVHYLRHEAELCYNDHAPFPHVSGTIRNTSVAFLMPCHSTPWRSHLVYPEIAAWALTCEPPVNMSPEERGVYLDEADVFYADPAAWIQENMRDKRRVSNSQSLVPAVEKKDGRAWPQYLVFFEHLEPTMKTLLKETRYEECWRGFNTHWHDDGRRKGDVVVWCMRDWREWNIAA